MKERLLNELKYCGACLHVAIFSKILKIANFFSFYIKISTCQAKQKKRDVERKTTVDVIGMIKGKSLDEKGI